MGLLIKSESKYKLLINQNPSRLFIKGAEMTLFNIIVPRVLAFDSPKLYSLLFQIINENEGTVIMKETRWQ